MLRECEGWQEHEKPAALPRPVRNGYAFPFVIYPMEGGYASNVRHSLFFVRRNSVRQSQAEPYRTGGRQSRYQSQASK